MMTCPITTRPSLPPIDKTELRLDTPTFHGRFVPVILISSALLSGCVTLGGKSEAPTQAVAEAAVVQPPPPPPPPPLPAIKDLVGLTSDELTRYFGDPSVRRREPPAQVWHYVGPECVLHLFLYSNAKGEEPTVSHVEISERGPLLVEAAERRDGVCIQAFLKPDVELPSRPEPAPTSIAGQDDDPGGDPGDATGPSDVAPDPAPQATSPAP